MGPTREASHDSPPSWEQCVSAYTVENIEAACLLLGIFIYSAMVCHILQMFHLGERFNSTLCILLLFSGFLITVPKRLARNNLRGRGCLCLTVCKGAACHAGHGGVMVAQREAESPHILKSRKQSKRMPVFNWCFIHTHLIQLSFQDVVGGGKSSFSPLFKEIWGLGIIEPSNDNALGSP